MFCSDYHLSTQCSALTTTRLYNVRLWLPPVYTMFCSDYHLSTQCSALTTTCLPNVLLWLPPVYPMFCSDYPLSTQCSALTTTCASNILLWLPPVYIMFCSYYHLSPLCSALTTTCLPKVPLWLSPAYPMFCSDYRLSTQCSALTTTCLPNVLLLLPPVYAMFSYDHTCPYKIWSDYICGPFTACTSSCDPKASRDNYFYCYVVLNPSYGAPSTVMHTFSTCVHCSAVLRFRYHYYRIRISGPGKRIGIRWKKLNPDPDPTWKSLFDFLNVQLFIRVHLRYMSNLGPLKLKII